MTNLKGLESSLEKIKNLIDNSNVLEAGKSRARECITYLTNILSELEEKSDSYKNESSERSNNTTLVTLLNNDIDNVSSRCP